MKNKQVMFAVIVAALIVVGGVVIAGGNKKSSNTTDMDTASSAPAADAVKATATNAVTISDYKYGPEAVTVKVGDTVTWTNMDSVRHNVVADKKADGAPIGELFARGETYSFKFTKAGTFKYHCEPHPYMHGTVVVTN